MKKVILFLIWILIGFGGVLFDAWILYAAYNLFYVNFTVIALPAIAYKNFLVFVLFCAVLNSARNVLKKDRKEYDMEDPETYVMVFKIISSKLLALGLFWVFTLFF